MKFHYYYCWSDNSCCISCFTSDMLRIYYEIIFYSNKIMAFDLSLTISCYNSFSISCLYNWEEWVGEIEFYLEVTASTRFLESTWVYFVDSNEVEDSSVNCVYSVNSVYPISSFLYICSFSTLLGKISNPLISGKKYFEVYMFDSDAEGDISVTLLTIEFIYCYDERNISYILSC